MRISISKLAQGCLFTVVIGMYALRVDAASYGYLDDAYTTPPPSGGSGAPNVSNDLFPRLMLSDPQSLKGTAEQYSKYQIIASQPGNLKKMASVQSKYPDFMYFRQTSPRAFLGYNSPYCSQLHGMPFGTTGAASGGCAVYAGHWLYAAGTTLRASLSASGTTVSVGDASRFDVGQYVVIYNAPAGSFNNAEHAKVVARNLSNNTLTLSARGYKSTARAHAAGSIIAQHVLGQGGGNALNWSYNMSTVGPRDANGKTYDQAAADWLKANYQKDPNGNLVNIKVSGLLFDADFYYALDNKRIDANNDLAVDNGISGAGVNWWGKGVESY